MKIPSDGHGVKCDLTGKDDIPSLTNLAIAQMMRDGTWKLYQPYVPDHILKLMRDNPAYYDKVEYPMSVMVDRPRRVNIPQRTLKVHMASATLVVGKSINCSSLSALIIVITNNLKNSSR